MSRKLYNIKGQKTKTNKWRNTDGNNKTSSYVHSWL